MLDTILHTRKYFAVSPELNRFVTVLNSGITPDGRYPLRASDVSRSMCSDFPLFRTLVLKSSYQNTCPDIIQHLLFYFKYAILYLWVWGYTHIYRKQHKCRKTPPLAGFCFIYIKTSNQIFPVRIFWSLKNPEVFSPSLAKPLQNLLLVFCIIIKNNVML